MTEDEAKTKWCPFVQFVPQAATGTNRGVRIERGAEGAPAFKCIGSACMAWRTSHQWFDDAQQNPGWVDYPPYAFKPGDGQERDDGYCGLAGQRT